MRAALAARVDPALIIAGRTSAMSIAGLDEAVRRIQAYAEAGVDALFLTRVKSRAELDTLSGAVSVPLFLSGAAGELWPTPNIYRGAVSASCCKATCR